MKCCQNCFSDKFLSSQIQSISNDKGKCSFCKTENVTLIQPDALYDLFEPLIGIYQIDSSGRPLHTLLHEDWNIFSSNNSSIQSKIMKSITQNTKYISTKYSPIHIKNMNQISDWHNFKEELKHKNRFFPKGAPSENLINEFGQLLGFELLGKTKIFRARIQDENIFKMKDLKQPPKTKVSNGRSNPIGIPYLYAASTCETAIAEVRPHKGNIVAVANILTKTKLDLYDLRNPKHSISPFELLDNIDFLYSNMPFFELLGDELSIPIVPQKANLEYLPTQYLCEMIKNTGFGGIIFRSSIASGNNYVVFSERRLFFENIIKFQITDTSLAFETSK